MASAAKVSLKAPPIKLKSAFDKPINKVSVVLWRDDICLEGIFSRWQ